MHGQLRVLDFLPRRLFTMPKHGLSMCKYTEWSKVTIGYRRHVTIVTSDFCSTLYLKASFSIYLFTYGLFYYFTIG